MTSSCGKKTLDICHNDRLQCIKNTKESVAKIQDELNSLNKSIEECLSDLPQKIIWIDRRIELMDELKKKQSDPDEISYYVDTSRILFEYYDLIEKGNSNQLIVDHDAYNKGNSILRFFSRPATVPVISSKKTENNGSRGSLLENYMSMVDVDYINDKIKPLEEKCKYCKSSDITTMTNDGYIFCNICHTMEYMIVDHDKPSYKEPPKEITYFSYKRINHLNEWLNQIQGKETTEIPEEIYDKILMEIKKQRITNMADLSYDKVKRILKQLKVHKYYEHIPHIINRLNGLPMPNFAQDLEEKLRTMFKQIQSPFLKHSPPNRKNFLSYSYVLHKFLQLLEKDEYLIFFQLLKSRDKLAAQDKIWKKICEEVGWQFIPSL